MRFRPLTFAAAAVVAVAALALCAAGVRADPIPYGGSVHTLSGEVTYDASDEDGDGIPETLLIRYGQPPIGFSVLVEPGIELIVGGARIVIGTNGDDEINESGSTLPMIGFLGAGDDTFYGGFLGDDVYGGPGIDTLSGGEGDDELHGGPDGDRLNGEGGDDVLLGGGGGDTLDGGPGFDQLEGGSGVDTERNGE